jgi:hypothetical protein
LAVVRLHLHAPLCPHGFFQTARGLPNKEAASTRHVMPLSVARSRLPWLRDCRCFAGTPESLTVFVSQTSAGIIMAPTIISYMLAADTNLSIPESRTPTHVGPRPSRLLQRHAVTMPPEALPVETWHIIITHIQHRCFAWFVLRQTCPFLALVTEHVFARHVSRTCSLRFAGQTLTTLL